MEIRGQAISNKGIQILNVGMMIDLLPPEGAYGVPPGERYTVMFLVNSENNGAS